MPPTLNEQIIAAYSELRTLCGVTQHMRCDLTFVVTDTDFRPVWRISTLDFTLTSPTLEGLVVGVRKLLS